MSSERQLADQRARDRIVSDLDRNLLVEAGAGSGKTHEMARRMAAGIATGVYQVEHMAAVTFTRKAAAELRGRFVGDLGTGDSVKFLSEQQAFRALVEKVGGQL